MSFARVSALRGVLRASRASAARPRVFQQISRRAYSEGHAHKEASSDLPWLIGAVGVTVPGLYFILGQGSDAAHGHDAHADSHAKSHKEEESKDEPEPEPKEEPKKTEEPEAKDEKKDEKDDKSEESKDDETTESKSEDDNAKESTPAAKDDGKKQGEGASTDEAATSKPPAEKPATGGSQSSKQEGLSNTDTKHSTDIENNPDKSKKPEGGPDTAKAKGTIDPKREQV